MRWVRRLRDVSLTVKLIVPAAVLFLGVAGGLSAFLILQGRGLLIDSLESRAELLAEPLATTIADSAGVADWDKVTLLLEKVRKSDPDISYALVVDDKGIGVATTDGARKGKLAAGTGFEEAMFRVQRLTRRPVPGSAGLFEVAVPLHYTALGRVGVLRLGVSMARVQAQARRATVVAATAGAVALALGLGIYLWLARLAMAPLGGAARSLAALAGDEADLTRRLPVASRDEIGDLACCFNTFVGKLAVIIGNVRGTALYVGAASQQLSAVAAHVATGTQQQAASLEETAASLEQITATVKQNTDNARQAAELAAASRDAADRGGRVVGEAVAAMQAISGASKRIADIITVIDEIAFQTNLLALNAAVEAARAGEQGRGFAVVAAEVRNLAQRSAVAAGEIKTLIKESVTAVATGAQLVNRSGTTLDEIVQSAQQVATIVAEIAAACEEQSSGIDQVNRAVAQMDRVTQDNASQTEDLSSTSQDLTARARQLLALVGRVTLPDDAPPADESAPSLAAPRVDRSRPAPRLRTRSLASA